ncbi:PTS sugar transporter subunit IIC [Eubacteriales bacterium OttesenSCG-928-N14]|nr:PTS sugar transporter subunit IIC [Eubacteriales bacterium OttesenSCG-928-N14]
MFWSAMLPTLVLYFIEFGGAMTTTMLTRPIIASTLVGIVLGDIPTAAVVGANLEIMYLGVVQVGGASSTRPSMAGVFGAAIAILFDMSWQTAVPIAIAVGLIGLMMDQLDKLCFAFFVPFMDRLIEQDKRKQFTFFYFLIPAISRFFLQCFPVFLGLYFGADFIQNFIANLPPFFNTAMNAAGAMLPAIGMAMLLNFMWDVKLVPYLIIGFAVAGFLGVSNVFMAILAGFLAFLSYTNEKNLKDSEKAYASQGSATQISAKKDEVEDFFDE